MFNESNQLNQPKDSDVGDQPLVTRLIESEYVDSVARRRSKKAAGELMLSLRNDYFAENPERLEEVIESTIMGVHRLILRELAGLPTDIDTLHRLTFEKRLQREKSE